MSVEVARWTVLVIMCSVVMFRAPSMIRSEAQRPLLYFLTVFAISTLIVQTWFAKTINEITGIAQLNYLLQGLWGVLNAAVAWEFATHLADRNNQRRGPRRVRLTIAVIAAVSMTVLFAATPPSGRFNSADLTSSFAVYSLIAGIYTVSAAVAASGILLRHLPSVKGRTLRLALGCIAVGTGALAPVVTILTAQRLTEWVSPDIREAAFWISITRLVLVPLGCVIAAVEPTAIALLHQRRYRRLHRLWEMLRHATPDLDLPTTHPSREETPLGSPSKSWRALHRRVMRINDSIHHLHHSWASRELLIEAADYAAEHHDDSSRREWTEIACWLEVTRRLALAGAPKSYNQLVNPPFEQGNVEVKPGMSTSAAEVRRLVHIDRALHSETVRVFATKFFY